jgi:hypothetical protein
MFLYATTIALVSFLRNEVVNYTEKSSRVIIVNDEVKIDGVI